MTPFPSTRALDALRLTAAVGDAAAGRRPGFARRAAALAARFARSRGADAATIDAAWYAALLGDLGLALVGRPEGASPRVLAQALAAAPLLAARFAADAAGLPPATADLIRWHRERHDGTGEPDRLRWDGIPVEAAAVGLCRDLLARAEEADADVSPEEAAFLVGAGAGTAYEPALCERLRSFVFVEGGLAERGPEEAVSAPAAEGGAIVGALLAALDRRDGVEGRADRRGALAAAIARELGRDPERAAAVAALTVLGAPLPGAPAEEVDPLSRFARDAQGAEAERAAALLDGTLAALAAPLRESAERWDGSGRPAGLAGSAIDPLARVVAVAWAAQRLDAGPADPNAGRRIAAAAGTVFEPEAARAFARLTVAA